jgi:SAM-dependent methyltransferase
VAAARELGVDATARHRLRLDDGDLERDVERLTQSLVDAVGDGRGTVLAAPWREDGHPDHAAVGRAAAAAARRTDAVLWEYPVWFWHWAAPDDPRASWLRSLPVSSAADVKQRAIRLHRSQVAPLSQLDGDEALLSVDLLAHFAGSHEWYVVTPGAECRDDALDVLHRFTEDPWGADSRWYEQRKRDLLLAVLPHPRFGHALEIGCATGALTDALRERADRVLGVDRSPAALAIAQRRLAGRDGVTLADLDVPAAWPEGERFDLVVVSEVGYFLSPAAVDGLVRRISSSLTADGVVALCHWRHPVEGWVLDAAGVHQRFETGRIPPLQAEYRDRDVEIRVHAGAWPDHDR